MIVKCISSKYCQVPWCVHSKLHEYSESCDTKECDMFRGTLTHSHYPRCGIPVKSIMSKSEMKRIKIQKETIT